MQSLIYNDFGVLQWESIAILAFALVFLIVGTLRVVEFSSIGLRPKRKKVYITLHLLGYLLFTSTLVVGAMNLQQDRRALMFSLFVASMIFLSPGQFKIGMVRRRIQREAFEKLHPDAFKKKP